MVKLLIALNDEALTEQALELAQAQNLEVDHVESVPELMRFLNLSHAETILIDERWLENCRELLLLTHQIARLIVVAPERDYAKVLKAKGATDVVSSLGGAIKLID